MGVGFIIMLSPETTLFSKMVTVFGVIAPALMIPLLAGFLTRRVTWRGALAGLIAGLISGVSLYIYKTYFLTTSTPADRQWVTEVYEPLVIFIDCGVTIAAMAITSLLERRTAADEQRINEFFARLERPVAEDAPGTSKEPAISPFYLIGLVVMLIGTMLVAASFFTASRWLNPGVGLAIVALGYLLYRARRRQVEASETVQAQIREA